MEPYNTPFKVFFDLDLKEIQATFQPPFLFKNISRLIFF